LARLPVAFFDTATHEESGHEMEHPDGSSAEEPAGGPAQEPEVGTGDPRVDAAIGRLAELDGLPVAQHPQVFEAIHGQLVEVLGELHSGSEATDTGTDGG
jgi:hypothetical protein